jgi:hypothetical protein
MRMIILAIQSINNVNHGAKGNNLDLCAMLKSLQKQGTLSRRHQLRLPAPKVRAEISSCFFICTGNLVTRRVSSTLGNSCQKRVEASYRKVD